jgi:hypothetical protein
MTVNSWVKSGPLSHSSQSWRVILLVIRPLYISHFVMLLIIVKSYLLLKECKEIIVCSVIILVVRM